MSDIPRVVSHLDELKQFVNDDGVMEILVRRGDKKIEDFVKVAIKDLPESKEQELLEKVTHILNENLNLNELNLQRLGNIARLQNIGLLLNGLNLCATCVGFAIMYAKLNKMEARLTNQIAELQKSMKQGQDVWQKYEFNKVLADHTDMLDCQRRQQPYSEEKMRELIDREYNVLSLLISAFQKNISEDHGDLIFSIYSLLSMLTASLLIFDEIYYYNNHDILGDENSWHMAHDKWTSIFDIITSEWFVEKLQDYATFEAGLTTVGVDVYYLTLLQQAADMKQEIEDNQTLIVKLGNIDLFRKCKEITAAQVADSIKRAFMEAGKELDESVVMDAYQNAMQQAAMI